MTNLKIKKSKNQKIIFLFFFFLTPNTYYSQTTKESLPVFILQGTVKLKGKPVDGVSLELTKDGKQITKIVTKKNGMYSFQMNKSNTDTESQYLLNITKAGTFSGILGLNTYTTKEEFNYVPYIFNLEIKLIQPTGSEVRKEHDFGRIKWYPERGLFDFDKEYVRKIAKDTDSLKIDSSKYVVDETEKIKQAEVAEMKDKKDKEAKQKADSLLVQQLANKESIHKLLELKEKKEMITNKKELAFDNTEHEKTDSKTEVSNPKSQNSNQKTDTSNEKHKSDLLKKKTAELAKLKTNEFTGKHSDLKEKKETESNQKELEAGSEKRVVNNRTTTNSLVNLRALENRQQAPNLSSADMDQNSFDVATIFSMNNEKNKLLNAKEKMERKKAANLAQKYETSNILTSLLDVVEEYDKK